MKIAWQCPSKAHKSILHGVVMTCCDTCFICSTYISHLYLLTVFSEMLFPNTNIIKLQWHFMWVLWEAEINQFMTWVSQDLEVLRTIAWNAEVRVTLRTDWLKTPQKKRMWSSWWTRSWFATEHETKMHICTDCVLHYISQIIAVRSRKVIITLSSVLGGPHLE